MALDNVDFDIDGITAAGARAIEGAASSEALNQVDIEFLGKRSALTRAHRTLGGLDPDARKEAGRRLGEAQAQLSALMAARRAELVRPARSDPAPGSDQPWAQRSSAPAIRGRMRSFCSVLPKAKMLGARRKIPFWVTRAGPWAR